MESLLRIFRKLQRLVTRERFDDELAEEMAFHRLQTEQRFREQGMSAEEARYAAMREFGNDARLREQSRETVGFRWEVLVQDLRFTLRQLRSNPGFAAIAVVVLALGIGASTAIFSAVNPVLFESLPYPQASRIAVVSEGRGGGSRLPSFAVFHTIDDRNRSFEAIAVMKGWQTTIVGHDHPEHLVGQRVSWKFFRALAIVPALGRDFTAEDDRYRGPNMVLLGDKLWRQHFAADPAIVGRQIALEDSSSQLSQAGDLYTVIGVMPPLENVLSPEAQVWAPLQYNPALPDNGREWGHHLRMIARLRPGVSFQQAGAETTSIVRSVAATYAKGFESGGGVPNTIIVGSLQRFLTATVRPALLAIVCAVMLLLLIACVNVANLLLARGAQRCGEFAMRVALGAARGRILRQLLTESLLLALAGCVLGLGIAEAGVRALVALSPPELPRVSAIRLDAPVFLFALAITTLVGIAVGLIPALQASRSDPRTGLQESSRTASGGNQLARRTLVVAEVSLALVLLVSAGLLLRSLQRLFSIYPGFDSSNMLTLQVQETGAQYRNDDVRARFFDKTLDAVRSLPGVTEAAFTSELPLSGDSDAYGLEYADNPGHFEGPAYRYAVSPGYFETMHIPLRRGRLLNENDRAGAPVAVVISESLARKRFGKVDPIGQRLHFAPDVGDAKKPWATIVGVVGDVRQLSLALNDGDAFYVTGTQWPWVDTEQNFVIRAKSDPAALTAAVRSAIWSIDKDQPIVRVATMQSLVAQSESQRHFALILFEAFAMVALVLAGAGIFGVLASSVAERTREMGVRAALGAARGDILRLVIRQGMTMAALGIAIGILGAAAASRGLMALIFGVSRLDAVTYATVVALLLAVAAIACAVPAWRAAKVDPAVALRAQ